MKCVCCDHSQQTQFLDRECLFVLGVLARIVTMSALYKSTTVGTCSNKRLLSGTLCYQFRFLVSHFRLLSEAFASLLFCFTSTDIGTRRAASVRFKRLTLSNTRCFNNIVNGIVVNILTDTLFNIAKISLWACIPTWSPSHQYSGCSLRALYAKQSIIPDDKLAIRVRPDTS